jgi:hypothetical protein
MMTIIISLDGGVGDYGAAMFMIAAINSFLPKP